MQSGLLPHSLASTQLVERFRHGVKEAQCTFPPVVNLTGVRKANILYTLTRFILSNVILTATSW